MLNVAREASYAFGTGMTSLCRIFERTSANFPQAPGWTQTVEGVACSDPGAPVFRIDSCTQEVQPDCMRGFCPQLRRWRVRVIVFKKLQRSAQFGLTPKIQRPLITQIYWHCG